MGTLPSVEHALGSEGDAAPKRGGDGQPGQRSPPKPPSPYAIVRAPLIRGIEPVGPRRDNEPTILTSTCERTPRGVGAGGTLDLGGATTSTGHRMFRLHRTSEVSPQAAAPPLLRWPRGRLASHCARSVPRR